MKKNYKKNNYNKIQRFSIRKYSFGAASVAIATYLMFMGNGAVYAAQEGGAKESTEPKAGEVVDPNAVETAEEKAQKELAASKEKLAKYVTEIEGNLSSGKYDSKTEASLTILRNAIAKAKQAASTTTTAKVEKAHAELVTTVTTKLESKEKKEAPKVDTTNGQPTVGKKAENTEPKAGTNSIENTGSQDSRDEKAVERGASFRAETDTEKPKVSIDYDDPASQTFWITPTEETNITGRIKITDNSGKIVKGWMQKMGAGTDINIGYGLNNSNIDGETTATAAQPATLSVTGTLQKLHPNGKPWSNGSTIV